MYLDAKVIDALAIEQLTENWSVKKKKKEAIVIERM